jgi:hypothetical protein
MVGAASGGVVLFGPLTLELLIPDGALSLQPAGAFDAATTN